jgi:hypothetical protein
MRTRTRHVTLPITKPSSQPREYKCEDAPESEDFSKLSINPGDGRRNPMTKAK